MTVTEYAKKVVDDNAIAGKLGKDAIAYAKTHATFTGLNVDWDAELDTLRPAVQAAVKINLKVLIADFVAAAKPDHDALPRLLG